MATTTLFHGTETETGDGLDDVPRRIGRSSLLWLDVSRNEPELQRAAELLGIDERTIREVLEGNQSPDIEDRPSYTRITTRVPKRTSQSAQLAQVDCIVGERWVVTVHDEPVAVLEDFRERAHGSGAVGRLDGPAFLATLLEWVVSEFASAFDDVEAELEELDVRALRGTHGDPEVELRRLVGLRRDIGALHRSLSAHRGPLMALVHPELDALTSDDSARRFRALVDRFDITVQAGRDARASIVASFDVLMARTEHQTNEILKVLTLVSVLFLPGALIAGVLGMNFEVSLFDHPGLFWVAVGAILAIIAGTSVAAKARRWI